MARGSTPAIDEQVWRVCDHCGAETLHASAAMGNHLPVGWSQMATVAENRLEEDAVCDYCPQCTKRMLGALIDGR